MLVSKFCSLCELLQFVIIHCQCTRGTVNYHDVYLPIDKFADRLWHLPKAMTDLHTSLEPMSFAAV